MITFTKKHIFSIVVFILVSLHLFVLMQMIFFPYPELFIYSYLTEKGLLPYKEIVDQHFPGLMFLPINFHSLGIDTISKMRLVHLGVVIVSDVIYVNIAKYLFKKRIYALAALLPYIFWQVYFEGHVLWIESFVTPLVMLSFYFLIRYVKRIKLSHLLASALLFGISATFKQTVAPLIFLVYSYLILIKTNIRHILAALTLTLIPVLLVFWHYSKLGVLNDFIYWTITFNLTTFSQMGKTHPNGVDIVKMLPVFGFALGSLGYLFVKHKKKFPVLMSIYFIGTLFFAYARFDHIHLQPALPFATLICTLLLLRINKRLLTPFIIIYSLVSLYIFIPNFKYYRNAGYSPMLSDPETTSLVRAINKYQGSSKTIFAAGTYPHIYYLTKTLPPGNIFSFQFPWFMKITENKVLQGIIKDPPQLVIRDSDSEVGGYLLRDYMRNINEYINSNYKSVEKINNIEILVKI